LLAVGASRRRWGVPDHLFLSLLHAQSSPELPFIPGPPSVVEPKLAAAVFYLRSSASISTTTASPLRSLHPEHHSKVRNLIFPFVSHTPSRSTHRHSPELSCSPRPPRRPLRRSSHLHEPVVGFVSFHSSF
jgi:hypothetical protein